MTTDETVYYATLSHPDWPLVLAATERGFCFLGSLGKDVSELQTWVQKTIPRAELKQSEEKLSPFAAQFTEYFEGTRTAFDFPLDMRGTPFQQSVWKALLDIPYGQVRTYSDIAEHLQKPKAVRAVGSAIGKNPVMIVVPCHRVIQKSGAISGYRGSLEMKRQLLKLEEAPITG